MHGCKAGAERITTSNRRDALSLSPNLGSSSLHHRSRERILVKGSNFYNSILKIHFEKYFQFRVLRVMQKRRKRSTLEW